MLLRLEPTYTSMSLINAMLLACEDGLPENYILEPLNGGMYRIVCVDNEHAFVADDAAGARLRSKKAHADLHCKSVLFCLDQMTWPVDRQVRLALAHPPVGGGKVCVRVCMCVCMCVCVCECGALVGGTLRSCKHRAGVAR